MHALCKPLAEHTQRRGLRLLLVQLRKVGGAAAPMPYVEGLQNPKPSLSEHTRRRGLHLLLVQLRKVGVLQRLGHGDAVGGVELQHAVQQVQRSGAGLGEAGRPVGRLRGKIDRAPSETARRMIPCRPRDGARVRARTGILSNF